jgi:hypothetical protein
MQYEHSVRQIELKVEGDFEAAPLPEEYESWIRI